MQKLLIATHNKGKKIELQEFFADLPVELVSLSDIGITLDVEENGNTYEENSQKKAKEYARLSGIPAIADDGGLEIAALNGEPGVRSRRWLGHEASDDELAAHLAKVASELPEDNRNASFRAVLTLATPDGKVWSVEGSVDGIIAEKPLKVTAPGLPYRTFFYLPEIGKYYHEHDLQSSEMKQYNHRYKAAKKLKKIIIKELL
jgi:XTP/dITP diphosphohydrolase